MWLSGTVAPLARVSAARNANGRRERKTCGPAPAGMRGTPLTLAAFVRHACTSGWKPNAYLAARGPRTRIGMRKSELSQERGEAACRLAADLCNRGHSWALYRLERRVDGNLMRVSFSGILAQSG